VPDHKFPAHPELTAHDLAVRPADADGQALHQQFVGERHRIGQFGQRQGAGSCKIHRQRAHENHS
jgi:hypothetical protein